MYSDVFLPQKNFFFEDSQVAFMYLLFVLFIYIIYVCVCRVVIQRRRRNLYSGNLVFRNINKIS